MKLLALPLLLLCVAGCSPDDRETAVQVPLIASLPADPDATRFEVKRVGIVPDSVAYNHMRGVYIIVDTKTGKEYVGVSGIGISETGSHMVQQGKTSHFVSDER